MLGESIKRVLSERFARNKSAMTPGQILGALLGEYPDLTRQQVVAELLALEIREEVAIKSDWMVTELTKKPDSVLP